MSLSKPSGTKLTKSFVEKIDSAPVGKTMFYFDTELKGFGLRVSGNAKTYIVQAWVKGK